MEFSRYTITENDSGRRLDRVLRKLLPALPLSAVYRLIRRGEVRLDGKKAKPADICSLSSVIEIESRLAKSFAKSSEGSSAAACSSKEEAVALIKAITVFETPDLLFLNKPQGLATHGETSLASLLPPSEGEATSLSFKAGPLHRLDKGTTGLIAFSKSLKGASWFSQALREGKIIKLYAGILESRGKSLCRERWKDEATSNSKAMESLFFPIASSCGLALAVLSPVTGRKRQLRAQAAMRGMPLLGDAPYGGSKHAGGYFLHAALIAFPEERLKGLPAFIEAPFPERFALAASSFFGEKSLADAVKMVYASL